MDNTAEKILADALKLTPEGRARIAGKLIESLDSDADGDVEAIWLAEAERRYEGYREGRLAARSASDLIHNAHRVLTSP